MAEEKKSPFMQAVQKHNEELTKYINEDAKRSLLVIAIEEDGEHTATTVGVTGNEACLIKGLLAFANNDETARLFNKANKLMAMTHLHAILESDDEDEADDKTNDTADNAE